MSSTFEAEAALQREAVWANDGDAFMWFVFSDELERAGTKEAVVLELAEEVCRRAVIEPAVCLVALSLDGDDPLGSALKALVDRLSDEGVPGAMYVRANVLLDDEGAPPEVVAEAVGWLERAADGGMPRAQVELAIRLSDEGTEDPTIMARIEGLLDLAVAGGEPLAMTIKAAMLIDRMQMDGTVARGLALMDEAVALGAPKASANRASILRDPGVLVLYAIDKLQAQGTPHDVPGAVDLVADAVRLGSQPARELLAELIAGLMAGQVEETKIPCDLVRARKYAELLLNLDDPAGPMLLLRASRAGQPLPRPAPGASRPDAPVLAAAEASDLQARADLGAALLIGDGRLADPERGFGLLLEAATLGHPAAAFLLGECYAQGLGTPPDPATSVSWSRKSADFGIAGGMHNLGLYYLYGLGVPQDRQEGLDWLRKAAGSGYIHSPVFLANQIEAQADAEGVPVPPEYETWLRKGAEIGDAYSCFLLGQRYREGQAVERDLAAAIGWLELGVEHGGAWANEALGILLHVGEGVAQDQPRAARCFRFAAEAGMPEAQFNLGICHMLGLGVPPDVHEAAHWLLTAATTGHTEAQYNLGKFYDDGIGVRRDPAAAVGWYGKAAEQGHAGAMNNLGKIYLEDAGVPPDPAQAKAWFQRAADLGDPYGSANLARCAP